MEDVDSYSVTNVSLEPNATSAPGGGGGGGKIYPNPFDFTHVRIVFIIMYSVVFLTCIIGNTLVIIVILKHRRMRTITNFFLANLAVADLCVGVFCVMPNLSLYLSPFWVFGQVICKLHFFVQAMSYTASIMILIAISAERYVAIIYPVRSKRIVTICLLRCTVVVVWIVAAACGTPYLFFYNTVTVHTSDNSTIQFCLEYGSYNRRAHSTIDTVLWYVLPLVLMTFIYSRIAVVLWRTSRLDDHSRCTGNSLAGRVAKRSKRSLNERESSSMPSDELSDDASRLYSNGTARRHDAMSSDVYSSTVTLKQSRLLTSSYDAGRLHVENNHDADNNHTRTSHLTRLLLIGQRIKSRGADNALLARRRVIRLLITVITSFTICVAPYHIRTLWQAWGNPPVSFGTLLIPPSTFVVYYMNSALNPILYAFLSNNFRKSLFEIATCRNRVCTRGHRAAAFVSGRTVNTAL